MAHVSDGTLKSWCRRANIAPGRSLVLARLLGAVILHVETGRPFQELLDVVDVRTLKKMLALGGVPPAGARDGDTARMVDRFLAAQCLVPDEHALSRLRNEPDGGVSGALVPRQRHQTVDSAPIASARHASMDRAHASRG